ncbi:MAG: Gfo/Idh/MocA family oxidoreductase [Phycisphaerales bacterium]|nr:MAG: Gfo/Idh/MocA family oxidoreductase [Phycisphaerales bacterium]
MTKVGIVGFGFMGRMHYRCWKGLQGAEVVAICDSNPNIVEDTKKAVGNIGGSDEEVDFERVDLYSDFKEMLAGGDLDALSLTLPTYLHADYSIEALSAGLNVLCEKPMALNVKDCERMISAAKKSGKVLQIGHCVRFWPEYAKAKEIVDGGEYGDVIAATFQRLGAVPTWSIDNWFIDEKRSGGAALDLHIHDTDFVQYLFGTPKAVCSIGGEAPSGNVVHIVTQYLYGDRKAVTAEGGWAMMPGFGFEMSFNIVMEKGTIVYDLTRDPAFKVCPAEGDAFTPEVEQGDGYTLQTAHFAKMIAGEDVPSVTTLEESLNSVKIVQAEKESVKKQEKMPLA